LLAPFPAQSGGAPDKVITAYLVAVDGIPDMYLGEAARRFLNGMAARNNPAFAPSPTELAIEAKRIWHRNLDLQRAATPSLPPPETAKKSAESIERVRRVTMGLVAALAPADDRPKRTADLSRADAMEALKQAAELARASGPIPASDELTSMLRGSRE